MVVKAIKMISYIVVAALMLFSCTFITFAADDNAILRFGRVYVYMPEITAEIYGSGYSPESISAMLGQEKLAVKDVSKFDTQKDTVCSYILIDLSTSMSSTFDAIKSCITNYIHAMNANDRLVVITFGEKVATIINGGETKEQVLAAISKLKCNQNGTLFFEALNSAYQLAAENQSSFSREYVISFSDGIDYQKGNATYDEIIKSYNTHTLPLYAVCSPNASKSAVDKYGEVARASGGAITVLNSTKVKNIFDSFLANINDVTIVKMESGSNIALGGNKLLSIKIDSNQTDISVPLSRSIPDNTAPSVQEIKFDKENNTFLIQFSEKINNGSDQNSYIISDSNGKNFQIANVKYYEDTNTAEVKMQDNIYSGDYTFAFNGITDQSMQANKLTEKKTVSIEGVSQVHRFLVPILIIAAVVAIIAILLIMFLLLRRKNKKTDDTAAADYIPGKSDSIRVNNEYEAGGNFVEVKHHIKAPSTVHLTLRIKTGKASEQKIASDITSSLIFGRSDTSDIYIDDTKMSRQHFVIENDNGELMLMDLGSTNGTMLNGIKVGSRQKLHSGDKIIAGLSDIIINIIE